MVNRFNTIITVLDIEKNKMMALKFKIIDSKLYVFNFYLKEENRNIIEVSEINGVSVNSFINKINENDIYSIETMKEFGVDTSNQFLLKLIVDDKETEYDILNLDSNDDVFYKQYEINPIIKQEVNINYKTNTTNNVMLDYASTNIKSLLSILKSNCKSEEDIRLLEKSISQVDSLNDNFSDISDNLDMLFLSTQLLMIEDKIDFVPEIIENIMKIVLVFDFGNGDYQDTNGAILTDNRIDYLKIIKMMRNSIAHSNYKVLENGIIEFYNEGKKKARMNFIINKSDLKYLFSKLYNYYYLNGVFPVIYSNSVLLGPDHFNEDELVDYLINLDLFSLTSINLKKFDTVEEQNYMDECLGLDLENFCLSSNSKSKQMIINSFKYNIEKHLNDDCKLVTNKLTRDDIMHIIATIDRMGKDYFYQLGKTSQIEIVNNLIKEIYNKKYRLLENVDRIIECSYNSNDSLTNKSTDYADIEIKIEILITAILNDLLLFGYNKNPSIIDASEIRFPESFYKDYLESKIEEFYNNSKNAADYHHIYESLLKVSSSHKILEKDFIEIENKLKQIQGKLVKQSAEISNLDSIVNKHATKEIYQIINLDILNRIRDCLAHGRLKVNCMDFNNVSDAKISIEDVYEGEVKFHASTTFSELMNSLMNRQFLQTLLNDNKNFKEHSK